MVQVKQRTTAREQLLEAASRLFYAHGMTATGIDTITDEAGVARKSLYNNFSSKGELMLEYIRERHAEWLRLYENRAAAATTPTEAVLAVFDAYIDHAEIAYPEGFRGCGLLNAAAELPAGSEGRGLVRVQKEEVEGILRDRLAELVDREHAAALACQFSLLLEGAMSRAGLEGRPARLYDAREIATATLRGLET